MGGGESGKRDNLDFGGYAVIKRKFGTTIRSYRYIKKDDLTDNQKKSIGVAPSETGNIWDTDPEFDLINNEKKIARNSYHCAEPHAFDKMLLGYRNKQDERSFPIKERETKSKKKVEEIEGYISEKRNVNEQYSILSNQIDELYESCEEAGEGPKEEIEKIREEQITLIRSLSKGAKLKMEALEKSLAVAKAEYEKANREKTDDDEKNKERLKKFVGRLKFNPAQNPDRGGKDKTEPTCPVCKQWVNKDLKIKENVFF